ncbi:MAG: protein kinase, partial [Planctomycetes bacterium]|nr:protein kinase [Planctomycetota bacterium]
MPAAPSAIDPSPPQDHSTSVSPVVGSESDPHLGKTFGGYELVSRIGAGGMGVVYKGRQVSLDRVVAVKILNKALVDNDEFIKRFEREAKSIARISHPNIVAVYDFGQTGGLFYMVTEFIEGSNLARVIGEKMMLSLDEALPLITHCLAGLHHVSASGIIHRDIKPDNILLTTDKIAKIADFGLAKNVTDDKTDLTAVGLAMGTPAYMSPEQCMGRRLDVRSDVYALGITAYFALTGEKPFVGQSSFEIMTKQREYMPPAPVQLNPRIPKEASALVMRMLAKNPQDRFRDAEECRVAWVDLGVRLNVIQSPMGKPVGSGRTTAAGKNATGELPALSAMPPATAPGMMPPIHVPMQPPMASLPSMSPNPAPAPSPATSSEVAVNGAMREPSDGRSQRSPTTERKAIRLSGMTEATTCAKCGNLNRAAADTCQRCGATLREVEFSAKNHEAQAEKMLGDGHFLEAAKAFGRLADKEGDRKLRSVWRSKEREARARAHDEQINGIDQRHRGLVEHGDFKGGLDVLERGLREVRETGASATDAETRLTTAIEALRKHMAARRRN